MPSKSPEQAGLMAAAAHTPGGYGGVPQSVGQKFNAADAGTGIIKPKPKQKAKKKHKATKPTFTSAPPRDRSDKAPPPMAPAVAPPAAVAPPPMPMGKKTFIGGAY